MKLHGLKLLKQLYEKFWEALINAVTCKGANDANFKFYRLCFLTSGCNAFNALSVRRYSGKFSSHVLMGVLNFSLTL